MFAPSAPILPFEAVSPAPAAPPPLPSPPSLPATVEYGKAPKQHACPTCAKLFPRRSNLTRHVLQMHMNAAKVECTLCGQHFKPSAMPKHAADCRGPAAAPTATRPASPAPTPTPSSAAPAPSEPSSTTAEPGFPRSELTIGNIDAAAADFFAWLQEPVLPTEHMVRKVATQRALFQMREGLRQIVREVDKELPRLFSGGVQVRLLVVPDVVSALVGSMQRRGVRASTVYPVALLLKKVCVWLCSRQSRATRQYVAPDSLPGWPLICQHCNETTKERKRDHIARRLRGTDEDKWMTTEEKNVLLSACLRVLHGIQQNPPDSFGASWTEYTDHLVVALLLLGLAPRQQTFRALTAEMVRPPGSDKRTPDQYVIDGLHGKTAMTYYVAVHPVLTSSLRFYLERVLGDEYRGPLFLQSYGKARQDFSLTTRKLTKQYVGRSINASKFRQTVATELLGKPGVKSKSLADLMGHDVATQQSWYVGTRMAEDARVCQDTLLEGVEVPAGMMG